MRLTGCNLRCSYCDTVYAYEDGLWLEIEDIMAQIRPLSCSLVEITGGEPLLQEETPVLVRALLREGFTVLMETNGSRDIRLVDERCVRIMDVKLPGSGEEVSFLYENLHHLTERDEIKFVIADRGDYDYAKTILTSWADRRHSAAPPLFSAVHGRMALDELAGWILTDRLDVQLQVQLHKVIWGAEKRGV